MIPAILPVGRLFHGHYQVLRCVKAGGMGAVYEVLDLKTQRRRALKVMLPDVVADPDLRARFRQEATITANIESEHIVETFDADVDPESGAPYLVMELLRGDDLRTVLKTRGRLPAADVVTLLRQVALALERTHDAGVIHRDLKPENLFLTRRDDGTPRVKILDFGIAKVFAQSGEAARTTIAIGTPLYMSPEQVRGDGTIGPRTDLYSLGQIAYTLLTGEAYWQTESRAGEGMYALVIRVVMGAPEPASARAARNGVTLPPAFDAWFAKATAVRPGHRFGSALSLVEDLAVALGLAESRPSHPHVMQTSRLDKHEQGKPLDPTTDRLASVVTQKRPAQAGAGTTRLPIEHANTTPGLTSDTVPRPRKRPIGAMILAVLAFVVTAGALAAALRPPLDTGPQASSAVLSATANAPESTTVPSSGALASATAFALVAATPEPSSAPHNDLRPPTPAPVRLENPQAPLGSAQPRVTASPTASGPATTAATSRPVARPTTTAGAASTVCTRLDCF